MSYATAEKQGRIGSMGLAVLINGSIILAVALSPIVAERIIPDDGTTVVNIPIKPDVIPPKNDTKEQPRPADPIFTPQTPFNHPPTDMGTTNEPLPPPPPFVGEGTGTTLPPADPPPIIKPELPPAIFVAATRDPRYARDFQPAYPRSLETLRIEGSVRLRVLIGKDGRVRQAQVVSATDPKFGEAAQRQALRSWRFRPATRGGEPVEDWQTLTIQFNMPKGGFT